MYNLYNTNSVWACKRISKRFTHLASVRDADWRIHTPKYSRNHYKRKSAKLAILQLWEKRRKASKAQTRQKKIIQDHPEKERQIAKLLTSSKIANSLVENLPSNRVADFGEKFSFDIEVPREYFCPVCLHILDKPIETDYKHYFCSNCIKGVITSSGIWRGLIKMSESSHLYGPQFH